MNSIGIRCQRPNNETRACRSWILTRRPGSCSTKSAWTPRAVNVVVVPPGIGVCTTRWIRFSNGGAPPYSSGINKRRRMPSSFKRKASLTSSTARTRCLFSTRSLSNIIASTFLSSRATGRNSSESSCAPCLSSSTQHLQSKATFLCTVSLEPTELAQRAVFFSCIWPIFPIKRLSEPRSAFAL